MKRRTFVAAGQVVGTGTEGHTNSQGDGVRVGGEAQRTAFVGSVSSSWQVKGRS
jgi:hypothetical protein